MYYYCPSPESTATDLKRAPLALGRSFSRGGRRQVLLSLARRLHARAVALPHDAFLPPVRSLLALRVLRTNTYHKVGGGRDGGHTLTLVRPASLMMDIEHRAGALVQYTLRELSVLLLTVLRRLA